MALLDENLSNSAKKVVDYCINNNKLVVDAPTIQSVLNSRGRASQAVINELIKAKIFDVLGKDRYKLNTKPQEPSSVTIDNNELRSKAYRMAIAYEDALKRYLKNPYLKYLRNSKVFEEHIDIWTRAALLADQVSADYDMFMKAQFWVCDKWFGRAPKPYETATYKTKNTAIVKYNMYMQAVALNQVSNRTAVVNRVRKAPQIPQAVKFQHSQNALASLMKNYNATEEQILSLFAKGAQAALYFDLEWLKQNPTYQKLKLAGQV